MGKRIWALALCCVMLTGCSLVISDDPAQLRPPEELVAAEDQLAGILVSFDHYYTRENPKYQELPRWEGADRGVETPIHYLENKGKKLYADATPDEREGITATEYHFPEWCGAEMFAYLMTGEDDPVQNIWSNGVAPEIWSHYGIHSKSEEWLDETHTVTTYTLDGTIYVEARAKDLVCYVNPVYQQPDGKVYALGTGPVGYQMVTMAGSTQTIRQEVKTQVAGQVLGGGTVTLTIEVRERPLGYNLVELDKDHQVVKQTAYAPGEVPVEYVPGEGTVCLILESRTATGTARSIHNPDDGDTFFEQFRPGEYGLLIPGTTQIRWEE